MTRAIDHATFTQACELAQLAMRIVTESPSFVLGCNLSARERREWENAARWFLAAQADGLEDTDFAEMVDEFYNPACDRSWALDCDFLRDDRASWEMGL